MQFTDAVTVEGSAPPVSEAMLNACKRTIHAFAIENDIPLPVRVSWIEDGGSVSFIGTHHGKAFALGVEVDHAVH